MEILAERSGLLAAHQYWPLVNTDERGYIDSPTGSVPGKPGFLTRKKAGILGRGENQGTDDSVRAAQSDSVLVREMLRALGQSRPLVFTVFRQDEDPHR